MTFCSVSTMALLRVTAKTVQKRGSSIWQLMQHPSIPNNELCVSSWQVMRHSAGIPLSANSSSNRLHNLTKSRVRAIDAETTSWRMEYPTNKSHNIATFQHHKRLIDPTQFENCPKESLQSVYDRPLATSAHLAHNETLMVWWILCWHSVGLHNWVELRPPCTHQGVLAQSPNHQTQSTWSPRNYRNSQLRLKMGDRERTHTTEVPPAYWIQPRFVELPIGAHQPVRSQHPWILWMPHPNEDLIVEFRGREQAIQFHQIARSIP